MRCSVCSLSGNRSPLKLSNRTLIPDLITASGRLSPTPEVVVDDDGASLRMTYRWRALPVGDYTLCMHGSPDKLQPYAWTGVFGYEGWGQPIRRGLRRPAIIHKAQPLLATPPTQ